MIDEKADSPTHPTHRCDADRGAQESTPAEVLRRTSPPSPSRPSPGQRNDRLKGEVEPIAELDRRRTICPLVYARDELVRPPRRVQQGKLRPRDPAPQGPDRGHGAPRRPHPRADREDQAPSRVASSDHRDQALPRATSSSRCASSPTDASPRTSSSSSRRPPAWATSWAPPGGPPPWRCTRSRRCSSTPASPRKARRSHGVRAKGEQRHHQGRPLRELRGHRRRALPRQGPVRVLVTIFGRQAPIDLEEWQIAKAEES
jgi:hypothetical protein